MSESIQPVEIILGDTQSYLEFDVPEPAKDPAGQESAQTEAADFAGKLLSGQTISFTEVPEDTAEFVHFVREVQPLLHNVARSFRSNSEQDVEDIVNVSLTKAWKNRDKLTEREDDGLQRWLFRIAKNTSIDLYRGKQRQEARELYGADDDLDNYAAEEISGEASYLQDESAQRLLETIREIADSRYEHASAMFALVHLQGYNLKEAAEIVGIPHKTALTRMHRTRKLLQKVLSPTGELLAAE